MSKRDRDSIVEGMGVVPAASTSRTPKPLVLATGNGGLMVQMEPKCLISRPQKGTIRDYPGGPPAGPVQSQGF